MKPFAYCLAAVAVCAPAFVHAQNVTDADARAIELKLDYYVPEGMAKAGIFHVRPSGDHYELAIDLSAFFTGMDKSVRPSAVQPLVLKLSQGADGLWTLSGAGQPKMAADFSNPDGAQGHLEIESGVTANIVFDPSLGFPRSLSLILDKPRWKASVDKATFSFIADQWSLKSDISNARERVGDLVENAFDQLGRLVSGQPDLLVHGLAELRARDGVSGHAPLPESSIGHVRPDPEMRQLQKLMRAR